MVIATRVKKLRQENNLTQGELGEKIGVHQKQVSAYERGINIPSTEVLIKMAETFNVTLDYLAFEKEGEASLINIQDRELLRRFEAIDNLSAKEKELAKEMLDLLILRSKFKQLAGDDVI